MPSREHSVLSLFTGCGGLDLGLELAGFRVCLCVENDPHARSTLTLNRPSWRLAEPGNIHGLTPSAILDQAQLKPRETTLVAAGPPCQPWSKSGLWTKGGRGGWATRAPTR